jgi:hypothetical protein
MFYPKSEATEQKDIVAKKKVKRIAPHVILTLAKYGS